MKKILAVLLAVIMLFSLTTFSSSAEGETPKVSIVTNQGSPVDGDTPTYFTVRFDNFQPIKGVDVTITASDGAKLGEVIAYNFKSEGKNDIPYKINENKDNVRFIDLLKLGANNARLVVAVTAPAKNNATITVTGKYAESGMELFKGISDAKGIVEVKVKPTETLVEENTKDFTPNINTQTTFIPVGGVYKATTVGDKTTYEMAVKNDDGTFSFKDNNGGFTYQEYKVPENGITTFGLSNDLNHPELLRFGNFSNLYNATNENLEHGTMIFEGDWLELKHYYIALGYEVKDFVKALYNNASAILNKPENIANGITHVYYNVPKSDGGTTKVNLYLFKQKNYMWKDEDNNILEYTVRLHGAQKDVRYTGIAYSVDNGVVTISENAKSIVATETDVVS